jgi:ribonuclease HII
MVFDIVSKKIIAGVDEVGRGSWAGPVVSAAVVLGSFTEVRYLKDSKKLSRSTTNY